MKTLFLTATLASFSTVAHGASLKPDSTTYIEEGDAVIVKTSLNLDAGDVGAPIVFSLREIDLIWDEHLGSIWRIFLPTDTVVMDGQTMVIDHVLVFSKASNSFTGYGNDFEMAVLSPEGIDPTDLGFGDPDFGPLDVPGFDPIADVTAVLPAPVPAAFATALSGLFVLFGLANWRRSHT